MQSTGSVRVFSRNIRHTWSEDDDVVAFYIWRFGTINLPLMEAGIARLLGMPEASLTMRQKNFASIQNGGGLDHVAAQSVRIYERYKAMSEAELRPIVLRIIEGKQSIV